MPIKELWYQYQMECIEAFLSRAFAVQDKYARALTPPETEEEIDEYPETLAEIEHAFDILLGYQDIVFRAVYSELNALVEFEFKTLAWSILEAKGEKPRRLSRGRACIIIEAEYGIKLEDLPGFDGVDHVRKVMNACKHDDGFSNTYEEAAPGGGWLLGYLGKRYELDEDKARESIKAVREFMRALPGERRTIRGYRLKPEDEATIQARRETWRHLTMSGALGHQLEEPAAIGDERGGYTAACKLCGKTFTAEYEEMVYITAVLDRDNCPGIPELRRHDTAQQNEET
jgi:hypothetical protein